MYTQGIFQHLPSSNRDKNVNSFLVASDLTPVFLLSPSPERYFKMVSFIVIYLSLSRQTDQKVIAIEKTVCHTQKPQ